MARPPRTLLLFGLGTLGDMLAKGNVSYLRHYERYFDEVYVGYLCGDAPPSHTMGRTHLVSLGGRAGKPIDLLFAPIRLYRFAQTVPVTSYLTADLVFSWWTSLLVRLLGRARVVLMPVALPESIYATTGRSLHGLPIWLERRFVRWSFRSAWRLVSPRHAASVYRWLMSDPVARPKTIVAACTVEEYPPAEFYDATWRGGAPPPSLIYVGRLHPEKRAADLVEMMGHLAAAGVEARLDIVGDGPERRQMEARAWELGVADRIAFHGALPHTQIIRFYESATLFVSTLTGTALREAGLVGVPVVAYAMDWIVDLLRDGETALLVRAGDPRDLAEKVARMLADAPLRERLGHAFHADALARWPVENIPVGLSDMFAEQGADA